MAAEWSDTWRIYRFSSSSQFVHPNLMGGAKPFAHAVGRLRRRTGEPTGGGTGKKRVAAVPAEEESAVGGGILLLSAIVASATLL